MLSRSVLLVLIVFFSNQKWTNQQPANMEPYYCDSNESIEEVKDLNLQRLLYSYLTDQVYMILPDKIIYFRLPQMTGKNTENGKYNLVTYQAFRLMHMEPEPPKKVLGHFYRISNFDKENGLIQTQGVFEMYMETPVNGSGRYSDKVRRLNFDQVPGERGSSDLPTKQYVLFAADKEYAVGCVVNVVSYDNRIYFGNKYCNERVPTKKFLLILRSFDRSQPVNLTRLFVTSQSGLVITETTIDYEKYEQGQERFATAVFNMEPMPFTEFLGCHTKPTNAEREVKGLYYSANKFYIIFSRYYLIVNGEFMQTGNLTKRSLKAHNLRFEEKDTRFEILQTQWVKVLGDVSYLVPYRRFIFQIKLDERQQISELSQIKQKKAIDQCTHNTFLVQNYLYCFDGKIYNYMMQSNEIDSANSVSEEEKNYSVTKSIFRGLRDNRTVNLWHEGERLLWISNYEPGSVVFMTNLNMWLYEYRHFQVDPVSKQLSYNVAGEGNYRFMDNNWMEGLQQLTIMPEADEPVTPPTKLTEPTTNPPTTNAPTTKPPAIKLTTEPERSTATTQRPTRRTRPTPVEETENWETETEFPPEISRKPKNVNRILIYLIIFVALVILILLFILAFVYRKKQDEASASKQASLEAPAARPKSGSQGSLGSKDKAKSPSKEQLKSGEILKPPTTGKAKSPSKRSIRAASKEKAKSGSQTSLKGNKSPTKSSAPMASFKSTGFPVGKGKQPGSKSQTSLKNKKKGSLS